MFCVFYVRLTRGLLKAISILIGDIVTYSFYKRIKISAFSATGFYPHLKEDETVLTALYRCHSCFFPGPHEMYATAILRKAVNPYIHQNKGALNIPSKRRSVYWGSVFSGPPGVSSLYGDPGSMNLKNVVRQGL
jgi:hypothetical protein